MVRNSQKIAEPMIGVSELCKQLGVSKRTIYRWTENQIHSGIPFYRPGKYLLFRFSEIERWLLKYKASPGAKEFSVICNLGRRNREEK